ncbi:retrotransposon protein, putative, ty1-copia subclass [Tanacetum coccineum]
MHNMWKTVSELHALLIEYEKGKGKGKRKGKDKSYIPKPKRPKPSTKENPTKDDACHHCKEVGHCKGNYPAYLVEFIKKKKQVGTASSSCIFTIELFSFPNKSWVYDTHCGTHICNTKQGLRVERKLKQVEAIGSDDLVLSNGLVICLDDCHYAPSITRGYLHGINDAIKGMLFVVIKLTPPYAPQHNGVFERWNRTLSDMVRSMINLTTLSLSFWDYALETATRILNMILTKKVDKTPYELWYAEFLKKNLLSQEINGRAEELEEIQDTDTSPSEITSEIPMEVEGFEPPQEEVILVMSKYRSREAMDNSKHSYIPMQERLDLNRTQGASTPEEVKCMQNVPYASAENHTRTALKTNLKYLRNIKDMILVYGRNSEAELRGDCYCNAGFETNRDDIKSQKGYVSALNRGAVD